MSASTARSRQYRTVRRIVSDRDRGASSEPVITATGRVRPPPAAGDALTRLNGEGEIRTSPRNGCANATTTTTTIAPDTASVADMIRGVTPMTRQRRGDVVGVPPCVQRNHRAHQQLDRHRAIRRAHTTRVATAQIEK